MGNAVDWMLPGILKEYGTRGVRAAATWSLAVLTLLLMVSGLRAAEPGGSEYMTEPPLPEIIQWVCESGGDPQVPDRMSGWIATGREPIERRGRKIGVVERYRRAEKTELQVERFLRANTWAGGRLTLSDLVSGQPRPRLMIAVNDTCAVADVRRLTYGEGPAAEYIEKLESDLTVVVVREPLNPPVPALQASNGVAVGLLDSGINYLLPFFEGRLATDSSGELVGFDYWDMDDRPFDSNPARSPFFPQRHGTRTASVILAESPVASIAPYRYPRPDVARFHRLVSDASKAGVRIMNVSMGSSRADHWDAFSDAASKHEQILFIVSAGNDGRDLDQSPVYPASFKLSNMITVTSVDESGVPARGSNWGRDTVDIGVAAEFQIVTDFPGVPRVVSGSSYAAARISALAACLLSADENLTTAGLKQKLLSLARPRESDSKRYLRVGVIPEPTRHLRGSCPPEPDGITVVDRSTEPGGFDSTSSPQEPLLLAPVVALMEDSGWDKQEVDASIASASHLLSQCGIGFAEYEFVALRGPRSANFFGGPLTDELIKVLPPTRPAVVFLKETLNPDRFEAEAIGEANSRGREWLAQSLWMTRLLSATGHALAHELAHLLMNSGEHVIDAGNLMHAEVDQSNARLTTAQCDRMRDVGLRLGLLSSAGGASG